jgi:hypothetical protein
VVNCDECKTDITTGNKYYKSKIKANYDICKKCFDQLAVYTLSNEKKAILLEENKDDDELTQAQN